MAFFSSEICAVLYTPLVLFVTRIVFSFLRKKSKRWLVTFCTFIAVTLEHIYILITPAQKLRGVQKYILIVCMKIEGVEINGILNSVSSEKKTLV